MNRFRALVCLLATVGLLFCAPFQDSKTKPESHPEIRGVVLEPGSNQPVADAEVTLEYYGPRQPQIMPSPPKSSVKGKSDANGRFSFHPDSAGYFYVRVKKTGYSRLSGMPPAPSSEQSVTLSEAQPVKVVSLALSRPGRLTGRVVDEETGAPIADVRLQAWNIRQRPGMAVRSGTPAVSGADGTFAISELPAGDYAVEVMPKRGREQRVLATFSEADAAAVEQDFDHTFWPGGHGLDAILPVTLAGGESVSVGTMTVKKTGWYRVHVRFPGVNCQPGESIGVSEFQRILAAQQYLSLGQMPCRGEALVAGFPPGSYRLMFNLSRKQGDPESASVSFVINDKNVEVMASFEVPVTVEGSFVAAEGSRLPDLSATLVNWDPGGGKLNTSAGPVKTDAEGKFRIPTFLSEGRRLQIYRLNPGAYVKEIRYNGSLVKHEFIPFNKSAMTQSLTIVLDDRPAAIGGVVMKGDKPAGESVVIVAKWPPAEDAQPLPGSDYFYARTDTTGKFQLGGLPPGEYRAVALTMEGMLANPRFETLRGALDGTSRIELSRGGFQSLTLEASEAR